MISFKSNIWFYLFYKKNKILSCEILSLFESFWLNLWKVQHSLTFWLLHLRNNFSDAWITHCIAVLHVEDAGRKKELHSLQYFSRVNGLYRGFNRVLLLLSQNIPVGQFGSLHFV